MVTLFFRLGVLLLPFLCSNVAITITASYYIILPNYHGWHKGCCHIVGTESEDNISSNAILSVIPYCVLIKCDGSPNHNILLLYN